MSFLLPPKKENLNKYISLGTSCFTRSKLSTYGIKPRKKQGELTFPFDLCVTPITSIEKILLNDFKDYFDDLHYNGEFWVNKKYNIEYLHDKDITTADQLKSRYTQRIDNFRHIMKTSTPVIITTLFNEKIQPQTLNNIHTALKSYGGRFKYVVINLKYDDEIIYKEILYPASLAQNWYTVKDSAEADKKYIDAVLNPN
jgi:hypothetical protein